MLIIEILQRDEGIPGEPFTRVATAERIGEITPMTFQHSIVCVSYANNYIGTFINYNALMKWYGACVGNPPKTIADVVKSDKDATLTPYQSWDVLEHVDAPHYKNFMGELQWIETMNRLSAFEEPKVFLGALELTVRGYIDRMGKKDRMEQDILKAIWYLQYMVAYIANDHKPILIKDIGKIIAAIK